jgi:protein TonB
MDEPPAGLAGLWDALRDSTRQRKAASLAIALAIEALLILLLFTLGAQIVGEEDSKETVATITAVEFAAPPEPEAEQAQEAESEAAPTLEEQPVADQPLPQPEAPRPSPLALNPQPAPPPAQPQAEPKPEPRPSPPPKIGARIRPGPSIGPADTGNPRSAGDSQLVGTAPNGEPLYAARWYREPTDQELSGYLSTANGPGSALIACKTVADYYVEDCVLLGESPQGSQIGRAVMAAAWQFRVRPARIGGREQFGSWVRIRIDYTIRQKPR